MPEAPVPEPITHLVCFWYTNARGLCFEGSQFAPKHRPRLRPHAQSRSVREFSAVPERVALKGPDCGYLWLSCVHIGR